MKWIGKSYLIGLLVVLYLPIFYLMFYSFNSEGN
ncbi:ABC transporter permease, partial [Staphylococcus equorum]